MRFRAACRNLQYMMIQAFHLTKVHSSGVKVLDDAYFSASQRSFVAIIGESRTGKSTFLKILGGEEKPTSGVLRIDHRDIYGLSDPEKSQWLSEVGMIFPDLKLFPDKTVEENIHFILQVKGASGEGEKEAIGKLLSRAGLEGKAHSKPADLSSGEQSVILALRAMIFRPRLLLADDPFQGLDHKASSLLFRLFMELNKAGSTIVLSTQQMIFLEEAKKAGTETRIQWMKLDQGKLHPLEEAIP
ncbi:MAG TPA: ATP-binding cassette domain-containing protein [bacterium]|nr:ATP-binding cassette domain-containing protein [bacterium]